MKALSQLGVSTEKDGTLKLDTAVLHDALEDDFGDVVNLFINGDTTEGIAEQLYQLAFDATKTAEGNLVIRKEGLDDRINDFALEIEEQTGYLERYEVRLRSKFAVLESMIASWQSQNQFFVQNS